MLLCKPELYAENPVSFFSGHPVSFWIIKSLDQLKTKNVSIKYQQTTAKLCVFKEHSSLSCININSSGISMGVIHVTFVSW